MSEFDVIVVGGGHAGTEAAAAASRLGARVALVTHSRDTIGAMSCNPAIGGLGKGHLVREVDALDGIMGRAADAAGIQFRLLNRSKGPAVRGPRTQADRALYRGAVQRQLGEAVHLSIIEDEAAGLVLQQGTVVGLSTRSGRTLRGRSVVLTTGTFLNGVIHRGPGRTGGGRVGEAPSTVLAAQLADMDLPTGRLKTGTPPRLLGSSIDWDALEMQHADENPYPLSFMTRVIETPQIACGVTWTNAGTHRVIRERIGESAMHSGAITGRGPRYCPSIEDKVTRFPDRDRHQIFLEPEGLDGEIVYPNGISTSLAEDTQTRFVHSIAGLGNAVLARPGYAIEYDYIDPRCLGPDLAVRRFPGLFLAGQINGTTGYEEAAAQGLVAGLNAALLARGEGAFTLDRTQAYIGVLIDDLITRGVSEPYRMFTSRAEYRLSLRADNADLRLTPLGIELGCIGIERRDRFLERKRAVDRARATLQKLNMTPEQAAHHGIELKRDGRRRSAMRLLALDNVDFEQLTRVWPTLSTIAHPVREQMAIEALYEGYLDRQEAEIRRFRREESLPIPTGLDFLGLTGLSTEIRERLDAVKPATLGQAAATEGVTPGAVTVLRAHIKRRALERAG